MTNVMGALHRLGADEAGASAAEYALLLGIVAGAIALAAIQLGDSVACAVDRSTATIEGTDIPGHSNYGKSDPQGNAKGHRKQC
jgi:pilus assembly protein Flp/PilA